MAKANKKPAAPLPDLQPEGLFPFSGFRRQLYVLLAIGFVFYVNSLRNEYALDDGVMIKENTYVLEGTKGLKNIFTKHSMAAYYEKNHATDEFAGGRYRPLSIATFAIEQSLFGMKPGDEVEFKDQNGNLKPGKIVGLEGFYVNMEYKTADGSPQTGQVLGSQVSTFSKETTGRHFTSVLIYLLTIAFVFYLMRNQIFKDRPDLGFLCALIFAIHPIHTEVVDNIKSRDELMALLFVIMTFVFAFKYVENKKTGNLVMGMISLFMAMLSKEYGVLMFALLPLFFYFVQKKNISQSLVASIPYFLVMGLFFIIRFKIIPLTSASNNHATEILNNQYIAPGSASDKFATKIYVLSRYLVLQLFPHPLCVDYSYNQIPFISMKDWRFIGSLILHIGIAGAAVWLFIRRHIIGFFLLFYLAHLFLISNLMVEIGTTLGERLIYLPSFAYCIIFAYGLYMVMEKISELKTRQLAMRAVCAVLVLLCAVKVISRNMDWENDSSLFVHDLPLSPNSVLVNGNAGKAYIDMSNLPENKSIEMELVKKSIPPLRHSIELHPSYLNGYLNIGVSYFKLGLMDSCYENWLKGHRINPYSPMMHQYGSIYINKGLEAARAKDMPKCIDFLTKATTLDQNSPDAWANLGGAYFTIKNYKNAKTAWENALKLDPNHKEASEGYRALMAAMGPQ
jgi:tetratricopeptide (TPR) repeat protein